MKYRRAEVVRKAALTSKATPRYMEYTQEYYRNSVVFNSLYKIIAI